MHVMVIVKIFGKVEDSRNKKTKNFLYPVEEILLVAFATLLSGGSTYSDMMLFGKSKLDFFKMMLPFSNGIPSEDTFAEVFGLLNPKQFERCLAEWVDYLQLNYNQEIISIDGKTNRRSYSKTTRPIHMVSAWAHKNRTVLCCTTVDEKGNEIIAIPELLNILSLKGTIVTMDAMGCQYKIADQIVEQSGDYLISLKGNQGSLHSDVKTFFELEKDNKKIDWHETLEKDHGRIEKRKYGVFSGTNWLKKLHPKWKTVQAIGLVISHRAIGEKTTQETRYFIVSKKIEVVQFAYTVRAHWGVENQLHNFLDVALLEDYSRVRNRNAAANLSVARRLVVNKILMHKQPGLSKRRMRLKAGWDNDYLKNLLFQGL